MDSWPILEWIKNREPTASFLDEMFRQAKGHGIVFAMCRLNYGEVIDSIRKAPNIRNVDQVLKRFLLAPIGLRTVDDDLVDEAVELKSRYPIAYADAFAAALAIRESVPLVTGDPEFRALERNGLLELEWVGA